VQHNANEEHVYTTQLYCMFILVLPTASCKTQLA